MFTVVIPAYNCEKTIVTVINSVFKQTRRDLIEEVIVVNDGSTDATDAVVCNFIHEHLDYPLRYFSQMNHGVSYTRNFAIKQAKALWIALLDSDDIWKTNKIERQFEAIQSNPKIRLLGSQVSLCGTLFPKRIFFCPIHGLIKLDAKKLCFRSLLATSSVVFHRETAIELGLFNEAMQYSEDLHFFQKFLYMLLSVSDIWYRPHDKQSLSLLSSCKLVQNSSLPYTTDY